MFDPVYSDGQETVRVMDQIGDSKNNQDEWAENFALKDALKKLNKREKEALDEIAKIFNADDGLETIKNERVKITRSYILKIDYLSNYEQPEYPQFKQIKQPSAI